MRVCENVCACENVSVCECVRVRVSVHTGDREAAGHGQSPEEGASGTPWERPVNIRGKYVDAQGANSKKIFSWV